MIKKSHIKLIVLIIISIYIFYSCSKSSRRRDESSGYKTYNTVSPDLNKSRGKNEQSKKTVIRMRKEDGVYFIPLRVNGVELEFIFDTGAGIISISELEALLLFKQGRLLEEDIIGTSSFLDATGTMSEGTIINLRSVVIGNKELHNVKASVVHNLQAPLLLGQTALERFGKISIDYSRNTITFE